MAGVSFRFTIKAIGLSDRNNRMFSCEVTRTKNATKVLVLFLCSMFIGVTYAVDDGPEWRYSVRPKDTLIGFSKQYLLDPNDWRKLQTLNRIKNPNRMQLGSVVRVPLNMLKQRPASAEIIAISGLASLNKSNSQVEVAKIGDKLTVGNVLSTQANSQLSIQLADGSVVTMEPNATLVLDTLSMYHGGGMVDTKLRLQQGRVEVKANPKHVNGNSMQIITPSAVAAVRGTQFRVGAEGALTDQETLDGGVALKAAKSSQELAINKGFGSVAEENKPLLQPVALLKAPEVGALPQRIIHLPVVFNLPDQEGAVKWIGAIYEHDKLIESKISTQKDLTFLDLPDGAYRLVAKTSDKNGLVGYDAVHQFKVDLQPFSPVLDAPKTSAIVREPKPEFSWATVPTANQYQLQIAKDAQFNQIIETKTTADTRTAVTNNLDPGVYYWRVASIANKKQGPFEAVSQFTYRARPDTPKLAVFDMQLHNNWINITTDKLPEGLQYEAFLALDAAGKEVVWQQTHLTEQFEMPIRRYDVQYLFVRHIEQDGIASTYSVKKVKATLPLKDYQPTANIAP
jgi:hypothetical protein